jgi:GrpB-like predicted nucleotidyltransferase (UPF0157 family)
MILGLKRGRTKLVPHQSEWAYEFAREKKRLSDLLGSAALKIEHIGSTAVPDVPAKPIIDIAVAVRAMQDTNDWPKLLSAEGYTYFGDREDRGDEFYAKGSEDKRTIYLHVVLASGQRWSDYLMFRDSLRANASLRRKYSDLKRQLCVAHAEERTAYTSEKAQWITELLENGPTSR